MADSEKDYETKIRITGDSSSAERSISGASGMLRSLGGAVSSASRAVGSFMRAFSRLHWVVASVQTLIDLYRRLHDWMDRAAVAARELADRLENTAIATVARRVSIHAPLMRRDATPVKFIVSVDDVSIRAPLARRDIPL